MTIKSLFLLILSLFLTAPTLNAAGVAKNSPAKQADSSTNPDKSDKKKKSVKKPKKQKEKKAEKKKRKSLSSMDFDELEETKNKHVALGHKESALIFGEKMVAICSDPDKLSALTLELADLHFDLQHFEKAGLLYGDFVKFCPADTKTEYAQYKAILCSFYGLLDADRDQSATQETLTQANAFLERKDIFKHYARDVLDIRSKCLERLAQNELMITEFYLKRKNYKQAEARLKKCSEKFLYELPALEPQLLTFEYELANKQGNKELASHKLALRTEKFPDFNNQVKLASNKKSTFANRF